MKFTAATYRAYCGGDVLPAELKPDIWPSSDHFFDVVVEAVGTVAPADGYAFEQDQCNEGDPARCVVVEKLEHVYPTLQIY